MNWGKRTGDIDPQRLHLGPRAGPHQQPLRRRSGPQGRRLHRQLLALPRGRNPLEQLAAHPGRPAGGPLPLRRGKRPCRQQRGRLGRHRGAKAQRHPRPLGRHRILPRIRSRSIPASATAGRIASSPSIASTCSTGTTMTSNTTTPPVSPASRRPASRTSTSTPPNLAPSGPCSPCSTEAAAIRGGRLPQEAHEAGGQPSAAWSSPSPAEEVPVLRRGRLGLAQQWLVDPAGHPCEDERRHHPVRRGKAWMDDFGFTKVNGGLLRPAVGCGRAECRAKIGDPRSMVEVQGQSQLMKTGDGLEH